MPTHKLTPEIITAAIVGFEAQKTRIDDQIAELRAMLSGGTKPTAARIRHGHDGIPREARATVWCRIYGIPVCGVPPRRRPRKPTVQGFRSKRPLPTRLSWF